MFKPPCFPHSLLGPYLRPLSLMEPIAGLPIWFPCLEPPRYPPSISLPSQSFGIPASHQRLCTGSTQFNFLTLSLSLLASHCLKAFIPQGTPMIKWTGTLLLCGSFSLEGPPPPHLLWSPVCAAFHPQHHLSLVPTAWTEVTPGTLDLLEHWAWGSQLSLMAVTPLTWAGHNRLLHLCHSKCNPGSTWLVC